MEQSRLNSEQTKLMQNNTLLIKIQEELESSLYQCSINQTYANEPYLCYCGCGSIFDKSAIHQWLNRQKTCPISRRTIAFENLTLDRNRKNKVSELVENMKKINEEIEINKSNIERYQQMLDTISDTNTDYISYNIENNNDYTYYQVSTTQIESIKQTIYFLVDTSYSMNSKITIKNSEINCELSYLDLVKHSVGVFCKLLENNSNVEICIIKFSSIAEVICEPQYITSDNIDSINTKIGNLRADGQTNIYSAFLKSFEFIKNSYTHSNIILLTDGVPTKEYTPNGLERHIFKSVNRNNLLDKITINTIGLGYNLEIQSLVSLSKRTNGSYFYMPESSLVGPTIIHLLINLTTKCCKSVDLELTYENNMEMFNLTKNLELFHYTIDNNKLIVHYGSMNQSQELVVKISNCVKPINIKFTVNNNNKISEILQKDNTINIAMNDLRLDTITELNSIYMRLFNGLNNYNSNDAKNELDLLITKIRNLNYSDFYSKDFLEDITGQIYMGLTNSEYFNKWGKFFIPSIINFHHKKICPNFIQPGLQHYKNEIMGDLAEDYHEIFCTYDPPKPQKILHQSQYLNHSHSSVYNFVNYRSATNHIPVSSSVPIPSHNVNLFRTISSAGCFHGDSLVKLNDNNYTRISDLRKNMEIMDSDGNRAIIECVVTFPCDETTCLSEFPNGLKITPYHPVKIDNSWKFPIDIVGAKNIECDKVYNFVLNTRKSIVVNNIICCTLGHNIQGPVIGHNFFGTNNVIHNLKTKFRSGYDNGLVDNITHIIRSPNNNNIIGYDHN